MILRWMAAGVLEAESQLSRVNGYRDLRLLRIALGQDAAVDQGSGGPRGLQGLPGGPQDSGPARVPGSGTSPGRTSGRCRDRPRR